MFTLGNIDILKEEKIAFLCSRKISAGSVLKCYDWALDMRAKKKCIISGFHSQIEKDVLEILLKGTQSIIVALARGLKEKIEPELELPMQQGRLLIVTPFEKKIKRIAEKTAMVRNQMMIEIADTITVGYASKNGNLEKQLRGVLKEINQLV